MSHYLRSFSFIRYRIGKSNIEGNLHGNQWKNSKSGTNYKVSFSRIDTRCHHHTTVFSQFNRCLHNWCGRGCIRTTRSHVVWSKHYSEVNWTTLSSRNLEFYRIPFDTKNLTGFLIASIAEYLFLFVFELIILAFMTVAVGSNLILISIANELTCNLSTLNECAKVKNPNANEIRKQINEFIQLHSNSKELSTVLSIFVFTSKYLR